MTMLAIDFDMRPSLEDVGGVVYPVTKQVKLKEGRKKVCVSPADDVLFDDTFQDFPEVRQRRLREAQDWQFSRGVPTNDKTSSKNYDNGISTIIDGEHKTLTTLGRINESMESDPHESHIREHRMLLATGNLTETQRSALLEHLADHMKKHGKKLKAVAEAKNKLRKDLDAKVGYLPGMGMKSRAVDPKVNSVIPQDSEVDNERKRTAGNMAMESRMKRFDRAIRISQRRRSL